ncbi:50S ribosomal protein L15 [Candidatus Berkelbacteria bacterium]|nr:50S ribosomal protein L15 [Candidatus Berkelbacteria bacterium]
MITLQTLSKTTQRRSRKGRGIAAGQGKTGGRGTKGQKARSGHNIPTGFEGGQTKLFMRLPKKRGEQNHPLPGKATVTFKQLSAHYTAGERVTVKSLHARSLVGKRVTNVTIVARGTLDVPLKFSGVHFSAPAYGVLYPTSITTQKRERRS